MQESTSEEALHYCHVILTSTHDVVYEDDSCIARILYIRGIVVRQYIRDYGLRRRRSKHNRANEGNVDSFYDKVTQKI